VVLDWCGRARKDLQNNLRWQRGPVTLGTVRSVLCTGPRAGLLPAQCFAQRNVTTVGKSLVRIGTVADCCTIPVASADATGRYRRRRGGRRRRRCRRQRYPRGIHSRRGGVGRRGARCSITRVRLRFDNHLRPVAHAALIIRNYERGVLLLGDAHVITRVCLLHYMPRSYTQ